MQWKSYRYKVTEEGAVITQYDPEEEERTIQIPSELGGYPVTEIGAEAFSENGSFLEEIEVPSSVKRIGNGAFKMCMSLMNLILHNGLEAIGEEAFYLTPLETLSLPDTLCQISHPWELGGVRFRISAGNPNFSTDGYGLYQITREKRGTGEIGEKELLVVYQPEDREEYIVEEGTTVIGENAVAGNPTLRRVVLPDTVRVIREAAFEGCQQMEEVHLSGHLQEIEANAFSHCIRLKEIHLPEALATLGKYAISNTFGWSDTLNGLERITADRRNPVFHTEANVLFQRLSAEAGEMRQESRAVVKYFGDEREYKIPEDVTEILSGAFRRAGFFRIDIPEAVRDVGADAFRECKNLREIYLEESGTLLYIPGQPVYRKDEIMELFYSGEREVQRKEEMDPEEMVLPEKWQAFARVPISAGAGRDNGDPYEGYVFDYRGYDALLHTYLNLPDQYGMAICRLKYPVLLDEDVRLRYRAFLSENLPDILDCLAGAKDMQHLAELAELGFFTEENIESCIEAFNRPGCAKQMSYLLNYKNENLGNAEFDFSL